jgi:hypothetical protein
MVDVPQELLQSSEVCDSHDGLRFQLHSTADGAMEHPLRDLQRSNGGLGLKTAPEKNFALRNRSIRPGCLSEPWVRVNDYAQLVKEFTNSNEVGTAARYSPGKVIRTHKVVMMGSPDQKRVSTSRVEWSNLSIRTSVRRPTRLTLAHSKKWRNHQAALALWFTYYNFCRVHTTLTDATRSDDEPVRKTTPAMAAGLTDHVWSVAELLRNIGL